GGGGGGALTGWGRGVAGRLQGFGEEMDYWTRSRSGPYLARLHRPTLLLNARDDPFVPPGALPDPAALPPGVHAEFPLRGGHAGFLDGLPWRGRARAPRPPRALPAAPL